MNRFIDALNEQQLFNKGKTETKINIHIPIRGLLHEYCFTTNEKVKSITQTEIDFGFNSFQIPHITLYMGYLKSDILFEELFKRLYIYSKKIVSFEIELTEPYLKEPRENYLFLDTYQSEKIIKLKHEIKEVVDDLIEPLEWDVAAEPPHITLAYIKKDQAMIKELLKSLKMPPKLNATAIEVSFCGSRGSCLGSIKSIEVG